MTRYALGCKGSCKQRFVAIAYSLIENSRVHIHLYYARIKAVYEEAFDNVKKGYCSMILL